VFVIFLQLPHASHSRSSSPPTGQRMHTPPPSRQRMHTPPPSADQQALQDILGVSSDVAAALLALNGDSVEDAIQFHIENPNHFDSMRPAPAPVPVLPSRRAPRPPRPATPPPPPPPPCPYPEGDVNHLEQMLGINREQAIELLRRSAGE
jgi:hypothetical protein